VKFTLGRSEGLVPSKSFPWYFFANLEVWVYFIFASVGGVTEKASLQIVLTLALQITLTLTGRGSY